MNAVSYCPQYEKYKNKNDCTLFCDSANTCNWMEEPEKVGVCNIASLFGT